MRTEGMPSFERRVRRGLAAGAVVGGAIAALAVAPAAQAVSVEQDAGDDVRAKLPAVEVTSQARMSGLTYKTIANVEGVFAWDQGVSADNATLARLLYGASDVLCGSWTAMSSVALTGDAVPTPILEIAVTGDVENPLMASVDEYKEKAPARTVLGCTCAGNPADGLASANAAVEGFELRALIADARPAEGANAVTFVCADGYEATLPLLYVMQRYAIVVDVVNDEAALGTLGCSNQIWLGATAARSFARDVVEIRITVEDVAPAAPGAPKGANLPNVGVISGFSEG